MKKTPQALIYLSAIFIAVGVYLPLARLPVYGDITYNRIASVESYFVILFAISAPVLVFIGKQRMTIISAVAIWITLLFPALRKLFQGNEERGLLGDLVSQVTDPLKDFAADLVLNVTNFSWGGYVFLGGLVLLTITSMVLMFKTK